jgi:hypothetical protein
VSSRAAAGLLGLLLAGCQQAPPPASGSAPPTDAMAPADMADAGPPVAAPAALPPPDLQAAEPVANDLGTAIADNWVGTWKGPEGTSLELSKQEVGYEVVITNLDGPRSFHGIAADEVLQFERDGATETVRAGEGPVSGMKWLADKHDCLIVKTGEGYCRD